MSASWTPDMRHVGMASVSVYPASPAWTASAVHTWLETHVEASRPREPALPESPGQSSGGAAPAAASIALPLPWQTVGSLQVSFQVGWWLRLQHGACAKRWRLRTAPLASWGCG